MVTELVSYINSSLHVAVYGSSDSLSDWKVKSLSGWGVGHLFLHLLGFAGLSSVLLLVASLGIGAASVME